MTARLPVITLDGPSGTGKGTVGHWLARRLGWHFLDSGALYRVLALAARRGAVALDDEPGLVRLAHGLALRFDLPEGEGEVRVLLDGDEVGAALRTEAAGNDASRVAALNEVREALLARQRAFRRGPGLVADGRDMGTTVFPDAGLKLFLTASPEVRAERRYKQLKEKGVDGNLPQLVEAIAERDARDRERAASPLRPAANAVVVDTSDLSVAEVEARVWRLVEESARLRNENG